MSEAWARLEAADTIGLHIYGVAEVALMAMVPRYTQTNILIPLITYLLTEAQYSLVPTVCQCRPTF
jgi:hypothetical protein